MSEGEFEEFEEWWKATAFPFLEARFGSLLEWESALDEMWEWLPMEPGTFNLKERRSVKKWFDLSFQNHITLDEPVYELEHLVASYVRYRGRKMRLQATLAAKDIRDFVSSLMESTDEKAAKQVKKNFAQNSEKPEPGVWVG